VTTQQISNISDVCQHINQTRVFHIKQTRIKTVNQLNGLASQVTHLALSEVEQWYDGGLFVVGRVPTKYQVHTLVILFCEIKVGGLFVVRGVFVLLVNNGEGLGSCSMVDKSCIVN
jgi:hypothetical protein